MQGCWHILQFCVNGKSPPESNRPKERKKTLDDFDSCVIKRTVHSMYNRKIAPTVSKIKKEIEDTIKISKSTLTLTLLDLGYKYKNPAIIGGFYMIRGQ